MLIFFLLGYSLFNFEILMSVSGMDLFEFTFAGDFVLPDLDFYFFIRLGKFSASLFLPIEAFLSLSLSSICENFYNVNVSS